MKIRRVGLSSCGPLLLGALSFTAVLAPSTAQAQGFAERLSVRAEGGLALMVVTPQTDLYGLGYYGRLAAGLRIAEPIGIYAFGGHWAWGGKDVTNPVNAVTTTTPVGRATIFGAGLRLDPEISRSLGRLQIEIEAGYSINGGAGLGRPYIGAGLGWMFPLGNILDLGPMVRFGDIFAGAAESAATGGTGNAAFLTFGLAIGLHGARAEVIPARPVDTDGDGVFDSDDVCPTVPQGDHPDAARRGCPTMDTDGDGVLDPDDMCPSVAAGDHPDPARRGCPLADRDGDGILDDADRCPDEPEDRDSFQDEDGCPDPDNDQDGILDPADQCPIVAETRNGFQDEDGCPDEAPPTATVVEGHININQPVFFDTDRATIQARSFPILDQVVQVMTQHPEILRIRIEGHTDDTGDARHNMRLSRDRATAVMNYIRTHGIARGRMASAGFGSTRPAAQGTTEEARALNRRVDFVTTGGAAPAAPAAPATPAAPAAGGHHGGRHGHAAPAAPAGGAAPAAPAGHHGGHHGRGH